MLLRNKKLRSEMNVPPSRKQHLCCIDDESIRNILRTARYSLEP